MKRLAVLATLVVGLSVIGAASADPTRHFGTFEAVCDGHTLVLVSKPGSSAVVTLDGQDSTSVSILKGIVITDNGVVVFEFHKPFTEKHDVVVCTGTFAPGVTFVAETILTPRRGG